MPILNVNDERLAQLQASLHWAVGATFALPGSEHFRCSALRLCELTHVGPSDPEAYETLLLHFGYVLERIRIDDLFDNMSSAELEAMSLDDPPPPRRPALSTVVEDEVQHRISQPVDDDIPF